MDDKKEIRNIKVFTSTLDGMKLYKYQSLFKKHAKLGNKVPAKTTIELLKFIDSLILKPEHHLADFTDKIEQTKKRYCHKNYQFIEKTVETEDWFGTGQKIWSETSLMTIIDNVYQSVINFLHESKENDEIIERDDLFSFIYWNIETRRNELKPKNKKKLNPYLMGSLSAYITQIMSYPFFDSREKNPTNRDFYQKSRHLIKKYEKSKRED